MVCNERAPRQVDVDDFRAKHIAEARVVDVPCRSDRGVGGEQDMMSGAALEGALVTWSRDDEYKLRPASS